MNWIKSSLMFGFVGVIAVWTTACGSAGAVPVTPTALPTPIVQVTPTLTPIPRSPTPLPTATVPPSRTAVPTVTFTATPSPKDMLMAAFVKALAGLKTYRVEVPEESRYIAVKLPDAMFQEGENAILKIGTTVWALDSQGRRRVGNGVSVPFLDRANLTWLRDQYAKSPQVVLLGPGTAEGVPCIGYSGNFTVTLVMPPKTPGGQPDVSPLAQVVKIWFATADGFPRRVQMGPPTSITMNFFDLNEPFDLKPPQ